jgi:hypothetical protein
MKWSRDANRSKHKTLPVIQTAMQVQRAKIIIKSRKNPLFWPIKGMMT